MTVLIRFIIIIFTLMFFTFFYLYINDDKYYPGADFTTSDMPDFEIKDLYSERLFNIKDLEGNYLINVWASWCITCLVEHPFLTELSENNVGIIGLNYKDSDTKANAWLQKHGNPYLFSIYDPRGDLAFDLGVTGAPESYLLINNKVVGHIQGEMNQIKWENIFLPLIQKAQQR